MPKKQSKFGGRRLQKVVTYPKGKKRQVTPKNDLEAAVQKEVLSTARRLGIPLWRQNAGEVHAGPGMNVVLAPDGAADLTGFFPGGIRLEIECKRRYGGTQRPSQKAWEEDCDHFNVLYAVVHSGEEFEDFIRDLAPNFPLPFSGGIEWYRRRDELKQKKVPKRGDI